MGKMLRLRHEELAGLVFGPDPDTAIKFGPRGGMPEFEAWVDEDDPLLPSLLETERVTIVDDSPVARIYICPECDKELKSRPALKAHLVTHGLRAVELTDEAEEAEAEPKPEG